ncbi:hypothetical protein [Desulfosarcina cetonica]|uniref:hypothetical protein n=1 Tax=Desulfosarcina cetonica TaxID=90730 RepID=UPI0006D0B41B|nr:hypothetical protein [Desulfosarcina cetonica]
MPDYPLARGVSRDRQTGTLNEHWALIRESHCLGFECGTVQTVDEWVADQEIALHNRMNDRLLELISDKNRLHPEPLTPSESQAVHTALYDLDAFREALFAQATPGDLFPDPADADRARTDDRVLLEAALAWVRINVFNLSPKAP